jgi:hypothetical protein
MHYLQSDSLPESLTTGSQEGGRIEHNVLIRVQRPLVKEYRPASTMPHPRAERDRANPSPTDYAHNQLRSAHQPELPAVPAPEAFVSLETSLRTRPASLMFPASSPVAASPAPAESFCESSSQQIQRAAIIATSAA